MIVRPARSIDAPELAAIVVERLPDTRYAGHVDVDEPTARKLFAYAAQRHGGTNEGATWLTVAESDDRIEAFFMGSLSRIYGVGTKLGASDMFLLGRKKCHPRVLRSLLDGYIAWAEANPKVYEIGLSWADSIPGNEAIVRTYQRRGFSLFSKAYRRDARPLEASS